MKVCGKRDFDGLARAIVAKILKQYCGAHSGTLPNREIGYQNRIYKQEQLSLERLHCFDAERYLPLLKPFG